MDIWSNLCTNVCDLPSQVSELVFFSEFVHYQVACTCLIFLILVSRVCARMLDVAGPVYTCSGAGVLGVSTGLVFIL